MQVNSLVNEEESLRIGNSKLEFVGPITDTVFEPELATYIFLLVGLYAKPTGIPVPSKQII
jgi:hypothetical protein